MVADATPALYIDQLKRLGNNGIQAYFALAHVHSLEIVERLIHQGASTWDRSTIFTAGLFAGQPRVRRVCDVCG
jgi:hypothetical protein